MTTTREAGVPVTGAVAAEQPLRDGAAVGSTPLGTYPPGEGPPDPDAAKQRVEELLKTHTAPNGPEPREDALDDPEKQEEPQ